jgi:hypothetical protein
VFKPGEEEPADIALPDTLNVPDAPPGQEPTIDITEQIGPVEEPIEPPVVVETDSNILTDD